MGGPYLGGLQATQYVSRRLSFSHSGETLLLHDRGQIALCDIRTEKVRRVALPGVIHAYCFDSDGFVVAASTQTGEVYRISADTLEVISKTLLAGFGPACAYPNFSADGRSLSAIADESLAFGDKPIEEYQPARWALFWDLRHGPRDKIANNAVWHCVPEMRREMPGHEGSFVCFAPKRSQDPPGFLLVVTQERESGETRITPFRLLAPEAQKQALLLHSLVENVGDIPSFDPYEDFTYDPPPWKPIHHDPVSRFSARSALAHPMTRAARPEATSDPSDSLNPWSIYGDPLR